MPSDRTEQRGYRRRRRRARPRKSSDLGDRAAMKTLVEDAAQGRVNGGKVNGQVKTTNVTPRAVSTRSRRQPHARSASPAAHAKLFTKAPTASTARKGNTRALSRSLSRSRASRSRSRSKSLPRPPVPKRTPPAAPSRVSPASKQARYQAPKTKTIASETRRSAHSTTQSQSKPAQALQLRGAGLLGTEMRNDSRSKRRRPSKKHVTWKTPLCEFEPRPPPCRTK